MKIKIIVSALLCALILCIVSSADVAPYEFDFDRYEARVSNPDGAVIYDYSCSPTDAKLTYGALFTVTGEQYDGSTRFLEILCNDSIFFIIKKEDTIDADLFKEEIPEKPNETDFQRSAPVFDRPFEEINAPKSGFSEMLTWVVIALVIANIALCAIILANTKKK